MTEARLLSLRDLMKMQTETTVFIETKQTLRPAFFMGMIDRGSYGIFDNYRYAVNLITPAKIVKHWEWRNNNKTWRVWSAKPTRDQMADERWKNDTVQER